MEEAASDQAARAFESGIGDGAAGRARDIVKLHDKIGQLIVEREFLGRGPKDKRADRRVLADRSHGELSAQCSTGCSDQPRI
ncbi:hypothetical protein [Bradyrhizobium sp. SEMIA]|uniref:hypothetical protein n=1 Tax=Bradyrhizobium sp. SEMIA TaxID=2597515 RepID=UPI0018A56077|nr:hypothetical protein [Bradyrhizobium sp. SEMIA]QOG21799.1 hypothetical protein FOM02_35435 [Bradyrhizobium sp. SEMIA]